MNESTIKRTLALLTASAAFLLSFNSCSKKEQIQLEETTQVKQAVNHSWFYLSPSGISSAENFESIPAILAKPYTESVRIVCFGQSIKPVNGQTIPSAYALVNRLGLIEFNDLDYTLYQDKSIFDEQTAASIVFMSDVPLFALYKNSFFNKDFTENKQKDKDYKNTPFLVQFDPNSKVFFPVITTGSMNLDSLDQINDFTWDGIYWYCSVKKSTANKTQFKYIKWESATNLLSILPDQTSINPETKIDANTKIYLEDSSVDEFRFKRSIMDYNEAPARIRELLTCLPDSFEFEIEVRTAGGPSSRFYSKNLTAENLMMAKAHLSDIWAACLFPDGTFYFKGALNERRSIVKTTALRLPKLPEGVTYTDFGITGDHLYAAWQENSFVETGKAGFLSVNLGDVLYED